jgi:predicted AlkP superfamily phosphohydrolase/phosphomutase
VKSRSLSRRRLIQGSALGLTGLALSGFGGGSPNSAWVSRGPFLRGGKVAHKVIVLGMDGLDPKLVRRFVAEGHLPTFERLMREGYFGELGTTNPPHSPVAWSSFITGTNPGGHGIYDFVHRDPGKFIPYMSTSRSNASSRSVSVGGWKIPIESESVELMRRGPTLWNILEQNSIESSVYAIPANFPVVPGNARTISGMGTPDLLGSYGTFTYFTEEPPPDAADFAGGRVVKLRLRDHAAETALEGPKNSFRAKSEVAKVALNLSRDPWEDVLEIQIDRHRLILKEGEWSEWLPLSFEMIPTFASVSGMVRFYVKEVHPKLKVYCSPINIDPMDPILPICTPNEYSRELSQAVGRFYTQGFPTDTKALSHNVLSDDEYHQLAKYVLDESLKLFDYQFSKFKDGFFFFYFSSTDQNQHMMLRLMDPTHPLYNPHGSQETKNAVLYFYKQMDEVLRQVLAKVDSSTTLIAMSDHGFAPFTREIHLSSWLLENGFTALEDPKYRAQGEFYQHVDWSRTSAYALGINGIYLNIKGREKDGIVSPDKADELRIEIANKLRELRDPISGAKVVKEVYHPHQIYSGPYTHLAPDLVVGYSSGYRISDEAVLGKFPQGLIGDRKDKWSADHCIDPSFVPGMLLSNRRWIKNDPAIWDLAPSILAQFGISPDPAMTGSAIFTA